MFFRYCKLSTHICFSSILIHDAALGTGVIKKTQKVFHIKLVSKMILLQLQLVLIKLLIPTLITIKC